MAEFTVPVVQIDAIEEHPNADRLEMAVVRGFRSAVVKDTYRAGDRVAYIPEASILPDWLIAEMGLTGRLAGSKANRVKAVRLRGEVSQGLVYGGSGIDGLDVGDDASDRLGISKWEPPIPTMMNGVATPGPTVKYDVENWQNWPDVLVPGERVTVSEKLHGTWCGLGFDLDYGPVVSSKGIASKGLCFDLDDEDNRANLYVQMWQRHGASIEAAARRFTESVHVLGEIHGPKVQDLTYGLSRPEIAVFDVRVGSAGKYRWLEHDDTSEGLAAFASNAGMGTVPAVYEGEFDHDLMVVMASAPSDAAGANEGVRGLREGIVVRASPRRYDRLLGAVVLKYVNPAYLTRSGGTEHN